MATITEAAPKIRTDQGHTKTLKGKTTASGTHTAGDIVTEGATIGMAFADSGTASEFVLVYECDAIMMPISGEAVTTGDIMYWSTTAANVTTASGGTKCGRFLEAAGTTDTEVMADLLVMA
jgi:predicted RecA/RadA family phage recombinase